MATRASVGLMVLLIGCVLLARDAAAQARSIVVDGDLQANADVLKVKMGVMHARKIFAFKFGEFAVVSSKMGTGVTTTSGYQSRSRQKFAFVLRGPGPGTASVEADQNVDAGTISSIELPGGVSIDLQLIAGHSDQLVATIALGAEPAANWTLTLVVVRRLAGLREEVPIAVLSDGTREIVISPVTSDAPGAERSAAPARGYQFAEGGKALGALQYYGGGLLGMNKNVVYLRRDLDPQDRLLLAAAMTAMLQANLNSVLGLDD